MKYSFDEINIRIEFCVKHGLNGRLMRTIVEHNAITRTTHTLNQFFSKIVFIVYFTAIPSYLLMIYSVQNRESNPWFKYCSLFCYIILYFLILAGSSLLAMLSKSAHKCYPLLYSILMTRSLTYRQRLRIESMISRLSGPVIGFYCLDLFAVNSYEFSQLILISVANYLFIIGLFQ